LEQLRNDTFYHEANVNARATRTTLRSTGDDVRGAGRRHRFQWSLSQGHDKKIRRRSEGTQFIMHPAQRSFT
jgi:hypothetical protein